MFREYKDRYLVYADGRVYNTILKRFMKPYLGCNGYFMLSIVDEYELLHRIIAKVFLPNFYDKPTVDHKDRNKENNSLYNLRWATCDEQTANRGDIGMYKNNTSGTKGVSYHKEKKRWIAKFRAKGKRYQKSFKSKEEAINQRLSWESEI